MRMREESPPYLKLSNAQLEILHVLSISPRALKPIIVYRFLNRNYYFSVWRSLQILEKNNLVTKIGNEYIITEKGRIEFDKRTR